MEKCMQKSYQIGTVFIQFLAAIFLCLLFFVNFLWTCYSEDMTSQEVLTQNDSLLINILILVLSLLFFALLTKWLQKRADFLKKILLVLVPCQILLCGMILLFFSKTVPAADAMSVYSCAVQIAGGDLSSIEPTGSYLSYYPQQIGLIAFWEPLLRLLRLLPVSIQYYHLLKLLYIVMTYGIAHYLYKITNALWDDPCLDCLCLLLCGLNAPLIMYSSFIYSEIPSLLAVLFGCFHLIRLFNQKTDHVVKTSILSITGISLAVLLRKNTLIFVIAVSLVLFWEWLRTHKKEYLLTLAGILFFSLSILPATTKLYELRAGNTLKSGVPAMSYFAMGMQESSRACGWYNGFNFNTYESTGMDKEATIALSKQAIAERLTVFRQNPAYCASFYAAKFLSQWADGTFASRQATLATFGGRTTFFEELYEGRYSKAYVSYCNGYQTLLYLGAGYFALLHLPFSKKKKPIHLYHYLLLIGAFGGFLFHMIWEANARYVLHYELCLLPYGVYGLYLLMQQTLNAPFFQRPSQKAKPREAETDTAAAPQDPETK